MLCPDPRVCPLRAEVSSKSVGTREAWSQVSPLARSEVPWSPYVCTCKAGPGSPASRRADCQVCQVQSRRWGGGEQGGPPWPQGLILWGSLPFAALQGLCTLWPTRPLWGAGTQGGRRAGAQASDGGLCCLPRRHPLCLPLSARCPHGRAVLCLRLHPAPMWAGPSPGPVARYLRPGAGTEASSCPRSTLPQSTVPGARVPSRSPESGGQGTKTQRV